MVWSDDKNTEFGNGEVGGDRNYTPPIHGETKPGDDVTFSQGIGKNDGDTLITDGHVDARTFYDDKKHDHFKPNGDAWRDRGAYTGK